MVSIREGLSGAVHRKIGTLSYMAVCIVLIFSLASASWLSLVFFILAVFVRIHVIRFVDAFQHSYEQVGYGMDMCKYTREYELENTFSLPVARKYTYLNLLTLNFGYHSAHHAVPSCPWYSLSKLDKLLLRNSDGDEVNVRHTREGKVDFIALLNMYHKYRTQRIISENEGSPYDEHGVFDIERFTGAFTDKLLG